MPDLSLESRFSGSVIGIDEAGRGPWAGPVTIAAIWLNPDAYASLPSGLDDSKKLSAAKRAGFYEYLRHPPHLHALVSVPVEVIDRDGILKATLAGMAFAANNLVGILRQNGIAETVQLLIDGNQMPKTAFPAQTVIKGDQRSLSIAGASIIAKHSRDQEMLRLAREFPGYGWDTNMGYGTAAHQQGLRDLGVTQHHRRSFAPVRKQIEADTD